MKKKYSLIIYSKMINTKTWTSLTNMLQDSLNVSVDDPEVVSSVMESWSSRKSDVLKLFKGEKKTRKDPNAPKKWKTAYIHFCMSHRDDVIKQNPVMKTTEITSHLARLWKDVSVDERAHCEKLSQSDKQKYEKEMEKYDSTSGSDSAKETKRPPSAYILFCKDLRKKVETDNPHFSGKEVTSRLGDLWKLQPSEQKAPYEERSRKEKGVTEPIPKESESKKAEPVKKVESSPKESKKTGRKAVPKPESLRNVTSKKEALKTEKEAGFSLFEDERTESLEFENPKWTPSKVKSAVLKAWKELPPDERVVYATTERENDESSDDE